MIIGSGLIANAFKGKMNTDNVILFASGPSDSKNSSKLDFDREENLILSLKHENTEETFVYFSTVSVLDTELSKTDYCRHKIRMEELVSNNFKSYLILRVSNIVGRSGNPKTIFNYFKNAILNNTHFDLWENTERNFIDVEDLVKIVKGVLNQGIVNKKIHVLNPYSVSVARIVELIEQFSETKADYTIVKKMDSSHLHSEITLEDYKLFGVEFSSQYTENLIKKYLFN
jgi:nucleoside-diphosphate-sugar epimerase